MKMGDFFLLSKPNLEPTEPLVCPPKPNLKKSSQTLKQTRFDPTLEGKHEKHDWCDDLEHSLACMDLYHECYDFEEMKKNDFKLVVEIMAGINNDTKIIWEIKECPIWCDRIEECKNGDLTLMGREKYDHCTAQNITKINETVAQKCQESAKQLMDKHDHEKDDWCDDLEHALACMDLYHECYDFEEMKKNDFKLVVEIMAGIDNNTKIIWEIKECPIWCDDYECKNVLGLIIVGASVGSLILISVLSVIVVMVRLNKSKGR